VLTSQLIDVGDERSLDYGVAFVSGARIHIALNLLLLFHRPPQIQLCQSLRIQMVQMTNVEEFAYELQGFGHQVESLLLFTGRQQHFERKNVYLRCFIGLNADAVDWQYLLEQ